MSTTPNGGKDTRSGDHSTPVTQPHRSSNLRWILGIGGGAIGGVFVGVPCYDRFPLGVLILLAVGAILGAAVPPVGHLAGLGAIVAVAIGIASRSDTGFLLCPLVGGSIGLLWSITRWARRRGQHEQAPSLDQEAVAQQRTDRFRLAVASLVAGLVLGTVFGLMIGGPFLAAGPFFGAVVGWSLFIGLIVSAHFGNRR